MKGTLVHLRTVSTVLFVFIFLLSLVPGTPATAALAGAISMTTMGSPYTQNFDTLSNVPGSTTNSLDLVGWAMTETGSGTRFNQQYAVDTGSSNAGDTYSYGAAGSTDRALGGLFSSSLTPLFGAAFTNDTGSAIKSLSIAYTGEAWRLGDVSGRTDQLIFEYSLDATSLSNGTWTNVPALIFTTPNTTGTAGARPGNDPAYRTSLSTSISGLNIANGAGFWIRWRDFNASGSDDGLAVDDFSITPQSFNIPALAVGDVMINEGSSGATIFTFTVSLTYPAPAGGVTFDIATADGTASAPGDYTAKTLTGQTIPMGSSTYTFDVLVNGDTTPEIGETFFVNVTNIVGASVADPQGLGAITNDDEAPNLTINDVTLSEGNSATTTFSFTVSLSYAAPAGGVTFDIVTANGTAVEPGDYTARSLTGQTIPAGQTTYTFDVQVNGDTVYELNETFTVNITNITNAIPVDVEGRGTINNDESAFIHDVQGSGASTPFPGATVQVEGVVTGTFQGSSKLQGFFLQEEDDQVDADPFTSEGIFIYTGSSTTVVAEGQHVRVTGAVSEFNGLTQISATSASAVVIIEAGNNLAKVTPAAVPLPITGDVNAFYEARENMLVTFQNTLTVSEYFELARFGHIVLYQGERPFQFTETSAPDAAGYTAHLEALARRRVILDDDNNKQNAPLIPADGSEFIFHPRANGGFSIGTQGTDFFRGGDQVSGLTGILHWSYPGYGDETWRIRPTAARPVTFTPANPRPATPPAVTGDIKAVSMNMLNYFTTIDTTYNQDAGSCGPSGTLDCRGADSAAELARQRERASIVICALDADVYGLVEIENTASATITDLLGAVNTRCGGQQPYAFVDTGGTLGTDAIRVMIIYRTGVLSPVGSPLVDTNSVHSRPPTAQTFEVADQANPSAGERFTVIVNHFKSKGCGGSSGADADANDGQGCFNDRRTRQAARLLTWVSGTVVPAAEDPDVLLLGDFNSYAKEDPVAALAAGGFTDLSAEMEGAGSYSYLFSGQLGHLDYAFASASLAPQVKGIANWHINADEVDVFDYNDEIKDIDEVAYEEKPDGSALDPARVVYQPNTPYRASDHDPVIVGLDLTGSYKTWLPVIQR